MAEIKLFVSDNDGTLTSGHMTFDHQGNVSKSYLTKDCTALWLLKFEAKIPVLILTGATHGCDVFRYNYLANGDFDLNRKLASDDVMSGIRKKPSPVRADHLIQGVSYLDKAKVLNEYIKERGIKWENVAYIGDDRNDLPALELVGHPGCPKNAHPDIQAMVNHLGGFVSDFDGGEGAVWDFANNVMKYNSFHFPKLSPVEAASLRAEMAQKVLEN